jgi:AcrR family transcriptional regulator
LTGRIVTVQPAKRRTAEERREDVIQAAIVEFATYGFHGGLTERIAVEAGISQPYVLRLFGTKKALFIAALQRVCDDIIEAWRDALQTFRENRGGVGTPEQRLEALQEPYYRFVYDVVELRLVLQASAAAEDDEIRMHLKKGIETMFAWVRSATGASYEAVREFWAYGMMLTIAASIGAAEDAEDAEWARAMLMLPNQTVGDSLAELLKGLE